MAKEGVDPEVALVPSFVSLLYVPQDGLVLPVRPARVSCRAFLGVVEPDQHDPFFV